jgi:hypothetical protein
LAGPTPAASCPGSPIPKDYTGTLTVQGSSSSPPSVANRTVSLSYYYLQNYTPKMGASQLTCKAGFATALTGAGGGFSDDVVLPTSSCDSVSCTSYSGPFGPSAFSIVGGAPAGYYVSATASGTSVGLAFVQALSQVLLAPSGRVTLSPDAPTVVHASAEAGDGSPSPASVAYAWDLAGNGWNLLSGSGTPNLTVLADVGAGPGVLALWVNGSFNGTPVSAAEATLDLAAVATGDFGGQAYPTAVDVGQPVSFTVTGTGAYGYAYQADLSPGLGLAVVVINCTQTQLPGGEVGLTCATAVSYTAPGTATPSANLTNGFSSAAGSFAPIDVAPGLRVSVSPSPALAYAGAPIDFSVVADSSSGTAPFGTGCLWTGDGRSFCYTGRATVVDAVDANSSAPFDAEIVARPQLPALVASTNAPGVGHPVSFSDFVTGGALPMQYWWNDSTTSDTLFAGTLTADGTMTYDFTPEVPGPVRIVLTVLDRLGTVKTAPANLTVGPGNASALVPRGGSWENWTVTAGSPYDISWAVADAEDNQVSDYVGNLSLRVRAPVGEPIPLVWVNDSGAPATRAVDGSYDLSIAPGSSGRLNFTVAIGGIGPFSLEFTSPLPISDAPDGERTLEVTPDVASARLVDPQVLRAGARSNSTLWHLADRFGDPFVGARVDVRSYFDGVATDNESAVALVANSTVVWVNFTAPGNANGTVLVYASFGSHFAELKEIVVPPAAPSDLWLLGAIAAAALLAALGIVALVGRRRRAAPTPARPPGAPTGSVAGEEELRRLAEGRAHVLGRAETDAGRTLDELARGFPGSPPTPEELTEWVASLLAEGSLRTSLGEDGRSRFYRTEPAAPPPRVELDDRVLDEALRNLPDDSEEPPADADADE